MIYEILEIILKLSINIFNLHNSTPIVIFYDFISYNFKIIIFI